MQITFFCITRGELQKLQRAKKLQINIVVPVINNA